MTLQRMKVSNFRCLKNVEINFEPDLTIIVGENDSGKSSLFDILKIIDEKGLPDANDFGFGESEISCELEFPSSKICIKFRKESDGRVISIVTELVCWGELKKYLEEPGSIDEVPVETIKILLMRYGEPTRRRTQEGIRQDFVALLQRNEEKIKRNVTEEIEKGSFDMPVEVIRLDGKKFEDISAFVKDIYLKQDLQGTWNAKVRVGEEQKSLIDIFQENLDCIAKQRQEEVKKEVLPSLREFLPNVEEITINIEYCPRDVVKDVQVSVKFKDSTGTEILFDKKGDGTKRRATLALLRHRMKKESSERFKLLLLDEPDTHLHVKAQYELISTLQQIAQVNQVIVITHSPFILNNVNPSSVRLLYPENGVTNVKQVGDEEDVKNILKSLGIENVSLFFTRKILVVEGESEEIAIPMLFKKYTASTLNNELITLLNAKGVDNVAHLARVITELMSDIPLVVLIDSDFRYRRETKKLLEDLKSHRGIKQFTVGYKEFEDAFEVDVIYESVKNAYGDNIKDDWVRERIEEIRRELEQNPNYKFSDALVKLSGRSKKEIAEAIARYCPVEKIPEDLKRLFDSLK
ncbi:ATP-dependent nuclease [Ammonifex thiophilus]|uniref:DUF2813 domain-containing protein n=1 Tax=Ammonifex thiophilus TaxID=444093 RepID=A0A3D8P2W0_9THEO|nr:AAA family ATPase [Ammonifex thiophilus]RDV81703.1 DUF2813 domain-containing protein [Ammonifex thiophilus]